MSIYHSWAVPYQTNSLLTLWKMYCYYHRFPSTVQFDQALCLLAARASFHHVYNCSVHFVVSFLEVPVLDGLYALLLLLMQIPVRCSAKINNGLTMPIWCLWEINSALVIGPMVQLCPGNNGWLLYYVLRLYVYQTISGLYDTKWVLTYIHTTCTINLEIFFCWNIS